MAEGVLEIVPLPDIETLRQSYWTALSCVSSCV